MNLLVVGGGGREHALCWTLRRENPTARIICAPGNPGTAELATNLSIQADDLDAICEAAESRDVDLTIIGPELPLANGLADRLCQRGRAVFGPSASAARIEASKAFAKELMAGMGVPTATSRSFSALSPALAYIDQLPEPLVVKASGLAAGKGAVVCETRQEARAAATAMLGERRFGEAGQTIVIEEFLPGEELSVLAITDGRTLELLPPAQDHKRLGEGDTGPNTGGMGAYSPVSLATPALLDRVRQEIFQPTLAGLERAGARYRGVLYAGLMVDPAGALRVVEFNCRLGDPEAQVILPLLSDHLTECLASVASGHPPTSIGQNPDAYAVTTVLASRGYPGQAAKGAEIRIPDRLPNGVTVFHAGTMRDGEGVLRVAGGRVLNVTAVAPTLAQARARSQEAAALIQFDGKVFRRDIGWREAERVGAGRSGR